MKNQIIWIISALLLGAIPIVMQLRNGEIAGSDAIITSEPLEVEANTICFEIQRESRNRIKVIVQALGIEKKIFGIAFDLNFPPDTLRFLEFEEGSFFESGGSPIYLVKESQKGGAIIAGVTLKRGEAMQKGSGKIITMLFEPREAKSPKFTFSRTVASTVQNGKRRDLNGIRWDICAYKQN